MNYDAQGVNIMSNEEFFKIQAKNLLHDYQTFTAENVSESEVEKFTSRESKLFSGDLFYYFGLDKTDDFTLMKAQHIVAQIAEFKNWVELKHSTEKEKELARLVFTNTNNSADILNWKNYFSISNLGQLSTQSKMEAAITYFKDKPSNYAFIPTDSNDYEKILKSELRNTFDYKLTTKVRCPFCQQTFTCNEMKLAQPVVDNFV